jgi:hypothetical protein
MYIQKQNLLKKCASWYRTAFSLSEIEENTTLKWVFGATLFSYYITFNRWISTSSLSTHSIEQDAFVCWPYIQNCADYLFLTAQPHGYSQTFFYMLLLGILIFVGYSIQRQRWFVAHAATLLLYAWHALAIFVLTYEYRGVYEYYLFSFATVLLFLAHKEYFIKILIVLFYFLSTTTKLHEAWVLGTYFSALELGLPLFSEWFLPLWTNQLIFMEMIGAWFLLSKNTFLQRIVLAYFVFFHLYSGVFVHYRYPSIVLPTLLLVYGVWYRHQLIPVDSRAIAGWLFVFSWCLVQAIPILIPGDSRFTHDGNRFGMYMFESNHQCVSTSVQTVDGINGKPETKVSSSSQQRCDPYEYLFKLQRKCASQNIQIAWTFDHSINGGPFRRSVDTDNACTLEYNLFGRNKWIADEADAPIVGYPRKNWFY